MPEPSPFTLAQAIFGQADIYAVCQHCGHFGVISFKKVVELGQETAVADVEKRFRCNVCKSRDCKIQSQRPMVGERVCPKCYTPQWKPFPTDLPRGTRKCDRCQAPLRR